MVVGNDELSMMDLFRIARTRYRAVAVVLVVVVVVGVVFGRWDICGALT